MPPSSAEAAPSLHFLDTNVVIYAMGHSPNAPASTRELEDASRRIIAEIGNDRIRAVSSLVVLQEIVHLMTRWARQERGPELPNVRSVAASVIALCDAVYTPTLTEFNQALDEYSHHGRLDFNDHLIVQCMRSNEVAYILTADRGFQILADVEAIDPVQLIRNQG